MADNIFPACYFPPIPWFAAAVRHQTIHLDGKQPYRKQQLSSRTYIKGANGVLPLTIPVERRDRHHPISEKKVSFAQKWVHQHKISLTSAYAKSPYFEFYGEELIAIFDRRQADLKDWLEASIWWGLHSLGWKGQLLWDREESPDYKFDYRKDFDTDINNWPDWFASREYGQVFGDYQQGLSIIDLVLNLGPEAPAYLKTVWKDEQKQG